MKAKVYTWLQKHKQKLQQTKALAKLVKQQQLNIKSLQANIKLKKLILKRLQRESKKQKKGWFMTPWQEILQQGWKCYTIPKAPQPIKQPQTKPAVDQFQDSQDLPDHDQQQSQPDILPSLLNKKKRNDPTPVVPQIQQAKRLLHFLFKNTRIIWPFEEKVDPIALNIPDYPHIVKNPMDLGTIRTKLHQGVYLNQIEKFVADVRLVFSNAVLYNNPHHEVYRLAVQCSNTFEKKLAKSKLITPCLPLGISRSPRWNAKLSWRRAPAEEVMVFGKGEEKDVSLFRNPWRC